MCATEIKKLLDKGAISKAVNSVDQFVSPFFLVDKPNGGKRFILNLKKLNEFLDPPHFKLEDWKTVIRVLSKDCFLATIDLEDAYFAIPIHKNYRKFLRFYFENQLYEFNCLPFGLSTAPFVFTRVMKPITQNLRARGWISVNYLDDFLLVGFSYEECMNNVTETKKLLTSLGFIYNRTKSQLTPSKICKFLGFMINSEQFHITLPREKCKKIQEQALTLKNKTSFKIRELAQFIGVLVSSCPAVKYGPLYTKVLEREKFLALEKYGNYNNKMSLGSSARADLDWWIANIDSVSNSVHQGRYSHVIYSDASNSGWGVSSNGSELHGWWSPDEKVHHINFLELKAAFYGLKCFASDYLSCDILLKIDNTTAISYINKMGSIQYPKLSQLSREIWKWCQERDIWIFASYIESSKNVIADAESRIISKETEWSLAEFAFRKITDTFGTPEIDFFATRLNNKCMRFVSWFPDPDAEFVDAFTLDWSEFEFYAFPPFSLVLRTIRKIINDKANGIVVVPLWQSQPWFPLFKRILISKMVILQPDKSLLSSPFSEHHPEWRSLTLAAGRLSGKFS